MAIGLLLLYIEFKTPGVILPGVVGAIVLVIWFWGHNIAGLAGMGDILLFIAGVALIGIEVFVFPGVGVIGVLGLFCMVAALLMAMMRHIRAARGTRSALKTFRIRSRTRAGVHSHACTGARARAVPAKDKRVPADSARRVA